MTYPGGYSPYNCAEQMGIDIVYRDLEDEYGVWVPDLNTIFLQPGMRRIHEICVLTHEIGHALLGHREGTPKNERQANLFMAVKLVDPIKLREVQANSQDPNVWANELNVTLQTLEIYLNEHQLGRTWDLQITEKDPSTEMETVGVRQYSLTVSAR